LWGTNGDGVVGFQCRPDQPRFVDGKTVKYETVSGQKMVVDCPPRCHPQLGDPAVPLFITEGPLKADAAAGIGLCCVALLGVWNWRNGDGWLADWEHVALKGRQVFVCFDSDAVLKPSVHGAMARLGAVLANKGAEVFYIYLPSDGGAKAGLDDYIAAGHGVDDLLALASDKLRRLEDDDDQEPEETFDDVDDEPLNEILDELCTWFQAHVAFADPIDAHAVTLWCAHTHCLERFASTPRLSLESPEPESGKTRTLELMEPVCRHGRLVLQMTPAAVYRWVAALQPTILLDEVDAIFGRKAASDHEDLRALINAGHRCGATVPRVEKPDMNVVEFSCYAPVALAGLAGALPDTIRSRAIRIAMRRRGPDETVRPFRERVTRAEGEQFRRRLAAWMSRHGDTIPDAPELPDEVTDRQADQWEPLVAVADAAGGHWPSTTRAVCVEFVNAARRNTDDQSIRVRLLADIRTVFGDRDRITTVDLVAGLCELDGDAPWSDWLDNKTERSRSMWLAKKLKPFGIRPGDHRFGETQIVLRGYLVADFEEAWARYLAHRHRGSNSSNGSNIPASDVGTVATVGTSDEDKAVCARCGDPNVYLVAHDGRPLCRRCVHAVADELVDEPTPTPTPTYTPAEEAAAIAKLVAAFGEGTTVEDRPRRRPQ
jgi:hypothetical protein